MNQNEIYSVNLRVSFDTLISRMKWRYKMRASVAVFLLICCLGDDLYAAYFRDGGWLAENGVLESIRIEPALPAMGEGFTVLLAGSWPEKSPDGYCFAAPEIDAVVVYPGNRVQIISNLQHDPGLCAQPPAHWNLEAEIPASAWATVANPYG